MRCSLAICRYSIYVLLFGILSLVIDMAPKAKQTISLELLKELGRVHLKEPSHAIYTSDDANVVVEGHLPFLLACAGHTVRLNSCSLGLVGKDVFQMNKREADLFGMGLASAYSHCFTAGAKATTGEKLGKGVVAVYNAGVRGEKKISPIKKETVKTEPGIGQLMSFKRERSPSPIPHGQKLLKSMHMESPTQIASLYGGMASSSSGMKDEIASLYGGSASSSSGMKDILF